MRVKFSFLDSDRSTFVVTIRSLGCALRDRECAIRYARHLRGSDIRFQYAL